MKMVQDADVVIVGASLGGVAAALAALRSGLRVVMSEEGDWVGGQLTSQGVPPDEHSWIESFGATGTYRALREAIRAYYRTWYPLSDEARADPLLNPGQGRVSQLCHEPRVAAAVLDGMLAPYLASGRLTILYRHRLVSADSQAPQVSSVTLRGPDGDVTVSAPYFLDATELGDLLPAAGVDHVTGFESRSTTGEPSAPETAQPDNMQAFSWVFALEHRDGEDHVIERPPNYDYWRSYRPDYWPGPMIGFNAPDPRTRSPLTRQFDPHLTDAPTVADQGLDPGDRELWAFRRVLSHRSFVEGFLDSEVTLVNWPMIDYVRGPLIGVEEAEREEHLRGARELSLSMLYWLQTEAPRPDGGTGWPGLRPRPDVMGTDDGFAKAPYIRESRRILAEYTVVENDLALAVRGDAGARDYHDSVGIGMYRIDLHPSTGGDNYIDVASCPFQIPLGALIPRSHENILAACKNIGTTHITNGCYRLHPVEWNIGEVAGLLVASCLARGKSPREIRNDPTELERFQKWIREEGVELQWPDDPTVKAY